MLRRWLRKFGFAFRGLAAGIRNQDSFVVHFPVALLVLVLAAFLKLYRWQWCALIVCITIVLIAEYINSAFEILVRKLHPEQDEEIAKVLDIAAAAVLIASIGAISVGLIVIGPALFGMLLSYLRDVD